MADSQLNQDLELIQLIEVARHGSRSPYYDIWDYRYNWSLPLKALTPIGQRQHYLIGQEIYKRYKTTIFNDGKFDQNQISVLCTSTDRAQQSALCQLYGIYYQKGENVHKNWKFNSNTDLPPLKLQDGRKLIEELLDKNLPNSYVPINVREPDDAYLLESCSYSDGIQKLKQINYTTDVYKQFDEQMREFKKEFVQKFNLQMNPDEVGLKMIADHWDSVVCDIYEQIPLPESFNQTFIQKLQFVYDFTQLYIDYQSSSGYLLKMQTTTFFNDVIDIIRNNNEIKFRFYSGSDNNLNGLLIAVGHINYTTDFQEWLNPTKYASYSNVSFSSTIFFEVYKSKSTNKKYIKMIYNDQPIHIKGCSSIMCDFEEEFIPIITKQAILPPEIFKQALQKGILEDDQS